jgi:U3 small nucleolar RNA-associated protein MPP10
MTPLSTLLLPSSSNSHTKNVDLEHVWQQIQLINEPMLSFLKETVSECLERGDVDGDVDGDGSATDSELDDGFDEDATENEMTYHDDDENDDMESIQSYEDDQIPEHDQDQDEGSETQFEADDDAEMGLDEEEVEDDDDVEEEDEENHQHQHTRPSGRVTELDDGFFSVQDMESFAERGEKRDMARDYFNPDEDEADTDPWNLGLGKSGMDCLPFMYLPLFVLTIFEKKIQQLW